MKAVFLTEGGKFFGFGHVVRCAALQEAFEEKGIISEFLVNADNSVACLLENVNHRICDWLSAKEQVLRIIDKEDIVIIDSYWADLEFYEEISKKACVAVYLDDHKRINYPQGIVLNSAIYAEELDYSYDHENIFLLGTRYASLRKEFWDVPQRKWDGGVRKTLITFGGTDCSDLIRGIAGFLKDKFHCTFHCVDFKKRINASSLLQLILDSDLCLSGGGQTVYNLARCGLPTIGICLSDNQLLNLEWWGKTKFLEYVGGCKDNDLLGKIEAILDAPNLDEFLSGGEVGQKYVDGQGARRVVQAILSNIS